MDSAHSKLALLELLPLELLFLIIDDLSTNEVLKLALTSRWMNHICNTRLYRSFEYVVQTPEQDKLFGNFLRALGNRPLVRQYVKDITIDERSLVPLQSLNQIQIIQPHDGLTYEEYKSLVGRLSNPSALKTADLLHRLGRLLALCGALTKLHISLFGSDQILCRHDYASVLAPLLRAADGGGGQAGNPFSQLVMLSLDLRSCKTTAIFLGRILDILALPSLKTSMLTFRSLESPDISGGPVSVSSIEELHVHVEAPPITTLPTFLSYFTNLTVFTYVNSGNAGIPSNISLALRNSASTLQRIDICTDTHRLQTGNRDSSLGFRPYCALRTLSLPLPHDCQEPGTASRSQRLQRLANMLINGLPADLQRLSFLLTADLTYRVPLHSDSVRNVPVFNEHGEHLFWSLLRQRLGISPLDPITDQTLSHMSTSLDLHRGNQGWNSDSSVGNAIMTWDRLRGKTSCDCDDLCKEVGDALQLHFTQLEKIELLHFETELAVKSRRYGRAERMYRTGAESGITIWTR